MYCGLMERILIDMKNNNHSIAIFGKNSYIGTNLIQYINKERPSWKVIEIDSKNRNWENMDFSLFDVFIILAGIVHVKESKIKSEIYYKINRDLAIDVGYKAKKEGVSHCLFFSTMNIYGTDRGHINKKTLISPKTHYGRSKFQAEKELLRQEDDKFKVAVIRPPMVYGKNCPGNYNKLIKFIIKFRFFIKCDNQRSGIYIKNLVCFVIGIIEKKISGVVYPQDIDYYSINDILYGLRKISGYRIIEIAFLGILVKKIKYSFFSKVFGDLIYDNNLTDYSISNQIMDKIEIQNDLYGPN